MSDYLWDKSGEPEAEVERLEELLGRLRHTRGAPELPTEFETDASTRASLFRSAVFSRPARLAAAAALLLAVLAGALVMLRSFRADDTRASVETEGAKPQAGSTEQARAPEAAASPSKESAAPEKSQREVERRDANEAAQSLTKGQERRSESPREAASNVREREVFKTAASVTNSSHVDARVRATRAVEAGAAFDLERRVRAKEQLVYAMRLTSEALKEVRGRTSGFEGRANAFDGRSPLR